MKLTELILLAGGALLFMGSNTASTSKAKTRIQQEKPANLSTSHTLQTPRITFKGAGGETHTITADKGETITTGTNTITIKRADGSTKAVYNKYQKTFWCNIDSNIQKIRHDLYRT